MPVALSIENHIRGLLGRGERLEGRLRTAFEHAYGVDLSALGIHTGPDAGRVCRAFAAAAVTVGADIFFAPGAYAPGSRAGLELLAHEIAHAVDQGGFRPRRTSSAAVSDPADQCEADARARAAAFVRGAPTRPPGPRQVRRLADSEPMVVQRHASWEHRLLGDAPPADLNAITLKEPGRQRKLEDLRDFLAMWRYDPDSVTKEKINQKYPTIRTLELGTSKLLVTYGELNTLADYLANPAALDSRPRKILEPILQSVRQESFHWINRMLGTPLSPGTGQFKNAVLMNIGWDFGDLLIETIRVDNLTEQVGPNGIDHYKAVVGRNACHFAPSSWYRWEQFYLIARDYATQAFHATGSAKERLSYLAWINHGYADHFLHDSFAAGHLINKTLVMQWFVEWASSGFGTTGWTMPVADWQMVKTMTTAAQGGLAARGLYDGFLDPSKRGVVRDPQTAEEHWALERRMKVAGIRIGDSRTELDAYKHYLRLINNAGVQLSSGILHDRYTKEGLYVASADHPAAFQLYGDCTMMDGGDGVRIAAETAQMSQTSISELIARGTTTITSAQIFNRFPTRVRGKNNAMLSLEQWNDSQRETAIGEFASPWIALTRGVVQRIGRISIDTTGGWTWHKVAVEKARDIAVGGDGSVWIITTTEKPGSVGNYAIKWMQGGAWTQVDGAAVRIAVDGAGVPWVVNSDGTIYRWDGGKWQRVTSDGILSGTNARGEKVSGASDIGAGADGSVWVTGRTDIPSGHPIFRWDGQKWEQAAGAAVAITVAPSGLPWVANDSGGMSRLNPGGRLGNGWSPVPGNASDIAVSTGVLPTAWMIGIKKTGSGNDINVWNGENWDQIPGAASRIAVGPDGTAWVVNSLNEIFHLAPARESVVAFTTQDAGKVSGKAVVTGGSLFPGDTVQINGTTDLSKIIVGNSGACVYSIKMDTTSAYYDFVIEADSQGPKGIFSGLMYLKFVDENGEAYGLSLFLSDRFKHVVRLDSTKPGIKEIRWSDSLF